MLEIARAPGEDDGKPFASGMISPPELTRANRNHISFFVNGRWAQNRMLSFALEQAYHGFVMERRFPIAAVNIVMPFEDIDVNVHPAKSEGPLPIRQPRVRRAPAGRPRDPQRAVARAHGSFGPFAARPALRPRARPPAPRRGRSGRACRSLRRAKPPTPAWSSPQGPESSTPRATPARAQSAGARCRTPTSSPKAPTECTS